MVPELFKSLEITPCIYFLNCCFLALQIPCQCPCMTLWENELFVSFGQYFPQHCAGLKCISVSYVMRWVKEYVTNVNHCTSPSYLFITPSKRTIRSHPVVKYFAGAPMLPQKYLDVTGRPSLLLFAPLYNYWENKNSHISSWNTADNSIIYCCDKLTESLKGKERGEDPISKGNLKIYKYF